MGGLHLLVRLHEVKLQKSVNYSTNYTNYHTGNTTRYSLLHLSVPHVSTSTFCHLRINSHDYRQLTFHGNFQITYYIKIVFLNSTTAFGCRDSSVCMTTTIWGRWKESKTRWGWDCPYPSRPIPRPIQPTVKWIPGHWLRLWIRTSVWTRLWLGLELGLTLGLDLGLRLKVKARP
jgi:hypothetical protein